MLPPMFARGSGPFLALAGLLIALGATLLLATTGAAALPRIPALGAGAGGVLLVTLGGLLCNFFRDPERPTAEGIAAAADGRIQRVAVEGDRVRISTFMNVHDVHVNRAPLDGRVARLVHHPGGHAPAYGPEASRNERVEIGLETAIGMVEIVQIAGILARRIVPYVGPATVLRRGDRIGLIRFGSRVDLVLPAAGVEVTVTEGQVVRAGASSLGRLRAPAAGGPPGGEAPA